MKLVPSFVIALTVAGCTTQPEGDAPPDRMPFEAELLSAFRRGGAEAPAYTSIVASGANACVLHYVFNNRPLRDGVLLLIDAAAEFGSYAADITRTFPVNGRFSAAQKDAYELVLAAQAAAIGEVRPGSHWNAPHDAAVRVLTQGMVDTLWVDSTIRRR